MELPLIKSNPYKWLELNYERHNITTLSTLLNVSTITVEKMLSKIGVNIELTPEQEKFIREFYSERTVTELVHEMNVPGRPDHLLKKKVQYFIHKSGLKKYNATPPPKRQPIKRALPDHTNVSHHDRVSKWLRLSDAEIKNHKGRIIY